MYELKTCNEGGCSRAVYALGKCSEHYHAMVFGGDSRIIDEEEHTCSNPLCGAAIEQPSIFLGVLPTHRYEYCASCRSRGRGNYAIPYDEYLMECESCGRMEEYGCLKRRAFVCETCIERRRKKRKK